MGREGGGSRKKTRCENNSLIMILAPRDDRFEIQNLVADGVRERSREGGREGRKEEGKQRSRRMVGRKEKRRKGRNERRKENLSEIEERKEGGRARMGGNRLRINGENVAEGVEGRR